MAILSMDLKQRVVDSVLKDKLTQAETARRLSVSESTVSRTIIDYTGNEERSRLASTEEARPRRWERTTSSGSALA